MTKIERKDSALTDLNREKKVFDPSCLLSVLEKKLIEGEKEKKASICGGQSGIKIKPLSQNERRD